MKNHKALWIGLFVAMTIGIACVEVLLAASPTIVGDWSGTLDPGAQPKKRILVHIAQAQDGTLSGTIDYPDENTSGIAITAITYKDGTLHFESTPSLSVFDGTMNKANSGITGTWKQGGAALNLIIKRTP